MTASVLFGRETHRRQFLEEHSINRPFPFTLDPQTQFTGFTFLQAVFIVDISYRISAGKSTAFFKLFSEKLTGESFNIFINYSNITTGNANINS
jgi:hypothetical protein